MKHLIKAGVHLLCIVLPTIYACSQVPPPSGEPPGAGPALARQTPPPLRGPRRPGGPGDRPIQQLLTIQGTVNVYVANDRNEYDGFTLQNSGQTLTVRFAPHMAAQLMAAVKAGATVSVQGFYETTPEGLNVLHLVNATAAGQTIYDGPPSEPATPAVETVQPFSGTITDFRRDPLGTPNGILLSGNRIIELSPRNYEQLQAYLRPGVSVSGSGSRVVSPPGVVLARDIQTIRPQTLTLNGQTYMVR